MTEHSIEELQRQLTSAEGAYREAGHRVDEARNRLKSARLDETGLRGHKVSYRQTSWKNREGTEVFFVVQEMARFGQSVSGPVIKKDGTLGQVKKEAHPTSLTDHGPFEVNP